MLSRRGFFLGLLSAPAIVKIDSIMPVKRPALYCPNRQILILPDAFSVGQVLTIENITNQALKIYAKKMIDNIILPPRQILLLKA